MSTSTLYMLYALLALGAAGVFLRMPAGRSAMHPLSWAARILGAAAVAALAVIWTGWIDPAFQGRAFVVIFALIAVVAASRVVSHPKPIYCALYLVLVVLAVAGLCILAAAEFLGIALVIVYGGAILVTYVFVIMLAQQAGISLYDTHAREPLAAVTLGFLVAASATQAMALHHGSQDDGARAALSARVADPYTINAEEGNVTRLGEQLMTKYVLAVEVAGVLLLVAMVGAVTLARRRIEPADMTPQERAIREQQKAAPRQAGRDVAPF